MNIRDLKYLVALAEHQHFGKAAEACFVSQPALSMQIQKLEQTLGIKLLERVKKNFLFTREGVAIAERARNILAQVNELQEVAKLSRDPYSGKLAIGIFPTLAPYLLPHVIPPLSKKFAKLSFYLVEEQTHVLINKLQHGQLDAAFLALPFAEQHFVKSPLFTEEFLLAVAKSHPLAKRKQLQAADLDNKRLLLLEEGHCLRDQALTFCEKLNAKETQDFRATSLETLRHMVANGVGMTLIPRLACHTSKDITYINFTHPKPTRAICLAWRNSSPKNQLLTEIADFIKTILAKDNKVKIISV